mmetsp:Transcript_23986/g.45138  ORF Transcript_23986/g.45138 Transcript_23986/m.45138 type:complete len:203 (-) Transcript_23986:417-1025(-)
MKGDGYLWGGAGVLVGEGVDGDVRVGVFDGVGDFVDCTEHWANGRTFLLDYCGLGGVVAVVAVVVLGDGDYGRVGVGVEELLHANLEVLHEAAVGPAELAVSGAVVVGPKPLVVRLEQIGWRVHSLVSGVVSEEPVGSVHKAWRLRILYRPPMGGVKAPTVVPNADSKVLILGDLVLVIITVLVGRNEGRIVRADGVRANWR